MRCFSKVVGYIMQLRDHPYYANVMNAVMEGNHAMGADT